MFTFGSFKTDVAGLIEDDSPEMAEKIRNWTNLAFIIVGEKYPWKVMRGDVTLTPSSGVVTFPVDFHYMRDLLDNSNKSLSFYEWPDQMVNKPRGRYYKSVGFDATTGQEKFYLYDNDETAYTLDVDLIYQKKHTEIQTTGSGGTDADADKIYFKCQMTLFFTVMQLAYQNRHYMVDAVQLERWLVNAYRNDLGMETSGKTVKTPQGLMGRLNPFSVASRRQQGMRM